MAKKTLLLSLMLGAVLGSFAIGGLRAQADDWPTFRHDQRRSGVTDESLDAPKLKEAWSWSSALPPTPAWPDAAKWDAYATLEGLRSMRNYDPVFHPAVVGRKVFLPSNADDTVRCFDLETGELDWSFTAEAPVRITPTIYEGQVLFGCDDGSVYALDAATGRVNWQTEVLTGKQRFINDGRIISFMPIRTGVLIDPELDRAVVSAGLFPWQTTHLAGLDLESGEVIWSKELGQGWTIEGALLLSPKHLIAPQGRAAPQLFSRETGEPAGALPGGGGSFVILTEDDQVLHGPGNKGGWITASNADSREKIASFDRGTAVVVRGNIAYLLDLNKLSAFDRETGEVLWSTECECPHDLILAGDSLFAGGDDRVVSVDANTGRIIWQAAVQGRAHGLVVSGGHLIVSTDQGVLHAFAEIGDGVSETPIVATTTNKAITDVPSPPVVAESDHSLLERWLFQADQVATPNQESSEQATVRSLAERGHVARLPDGTKIQGVGEQHAWVLDGKVDCEVAADFSKVPHPEKELTVETWVKIDQAQDWGGLLSMTQDNGAFEKGWILGFRKDRFGFALNGVEGPDRLTWVVDANSTFELGGWHHVAATYDGATILLYVDGQQVAMSEEQQGAIQYPPKAAFQLASYKDDDEHYFTTGMMNEMRLYRRTLTPEEIAAHSEEKRNQFPEPERSHAVAAETVPPWRGPTLQFTQSGEATVRWWTQTPQQTRLEIIADGEVVETLGRPGESTVHVVSIAGVERDELIKYRIVQLGDSGPIYSPLYECDGHFDYLRPELPESSIDPSVMATARTILSETRFTAPRGLAIVIGAEDEGALAEALCREGALDVVVLEDDRNVAEAAIARLIQSGVYGRPVSVRTAEADGSFRLPRQFADLVVPLRRDVNVDDSNPQIADWVSWVRPQGHILLPPDRERLEGVAGLEAEDLLDSEPLNCLIYQTPRNVGAASWTHMYASPDNSAFGGETLSGVRSQEDLQVLWAGRPGPRYQSDRGNRKPSPLAASGRLYMQGLYRVIALNAHNGTILWSWELPEISRFNVPRDCSNWCADEQSVFLAANNRCLVLDGATGKLTAEYEVYEQGDRPLDWGYVARHGELLLGSGVQRNAPFREFWGGQHWYDAKDGEHAKKVCSEVFFARDVKTGGMKWNYSDGLVVNPTITIANGRVHFVECRSEEMIEGESRRLDGDEFWNNLHLVTLDLATGEKIWDIPAKPMPGVSAMYLVAAEDRLCLQTSRDGSFAVYVLDAKTGDQVWRGKYAWEANHHGKHLSRPAIVGGKIYLRPLTLDLEDGTVLAEAFPAGHQCGTYTASRDALFLRAGSLAVWDRLTGESSRWNRARPDCWISTIPAEGMLLSPEGGGGCSCGGWIETSMGFLPVLDQLEK